MMTGIMPTTLECLRFAAQGRDFLTKAQIEQRARWVEADFTAIGLKHQMTGRWLSVSEDSRLPYAGYHLLGNESNLDHAGPGTS